MTKTPDFETPASSVGLGVDGSSSDAPIYVTRPYLPPLAELLPSLEEVWSRRVLTNGGPLHQQLEEALCRYLGVEYISLFANGTLALMTALRALRVQGEVITTPFSFVATAHSLLWNGITPVFVDIDPRTLNLDPRRLEAAITPQTTAILPVHCYGNPCDVEAIQAIAEHYDLKVIYDAAHAFGVDCHCGSVLNHGDLSVLSFHATKVFNTFEGGAIVCPDARSKQHIDRLKNFGFVDQTTVALTGINGKMSELNAAVGLAQLRHVDAAIGRRREIDTLYRALLTDAEGVRCLAPVDQLRGNHAYFPILVDDSHPLGREGLFKRLAEHGIHTRRYFHPLITEFPMYRGLPSARAGNLPVATEAARQVLCLPIYPDLTDPQVERIAAVIQSTCRPRAARRSLPGRPERTQNRDATGAQA